VLQDAGFPIYDAREGRRSLWRVEERFRDRLPVPLSLDEIVALLASRDLLAPGGAGPFGPAIAEAFGKIQALLTPRALEVVERMRASVGARTIGAKLEMGPAAHLAEIGAAVSQQRTLQIRYYSLSREAETDRRVDPYHLTFVAGGAYLVAYCHLRRDVRIFAVERIRQATRLAQSFSKPADFDAEAYLKSAWGIVRGELVDVSAVFARAAAPHVRGRLWHGSQELRELSGGRLEMRLRVADTLEVRRWLMGFGADVEVLAPAALREAIRAEAQRVLGTPVPERRQPARAGRAGGVPRRTGTRMMGRAG
jgi:predicted DNA-binding transcriptional regulator YafY